MIQLAGERVFAVVQEGWSLVRRRAPRALALFVAVAAGCSGGSSNTGTGQQGGSTPTASGGNSASGTGGAALSGGSATGGAPSATGGVASSSGGAQSANQPVTLIRFLQAYLNEGNKKTYDLWAKKSDQSWVSLVKGLAYGQMTDYIQVPIGAGLNTEIWFIPPGSDPKNYAISIGYFIRFGIENSDTGKHTLFMYHMPDESDWGAQLVPDVDPALTPPTGYSYVAFFSEAIRPLQPLLDFGGSDGCIDRAMQDNYQPVTTGSHSFAIFSGAAGAAGCQGSVLAMTPQVTLGDGDVWSLYAMGDAANGFELRAVKLNKD